MRTPASHLTVRGARNVVARPRRKALEQAGSDHGVVIDTDA